MKTKILGLFVSFFIATAYDETPYAMGGCQGGEAQLSPLTASSGSAAHSVKTRKLFAAASPGIAGAETSALHSLDQLLSSWKTLSADFTQQVLNAKGQGQPQSYKGQLYLSKPDRFRWVITQPEPQIIVADGKNLWIYDEELAHITVQPLSQQLSETPALFLSGEFSQIAHAFTVRRLQDTPLQYHVIPKKADHLLQDMTLTFNQKQQLTHMQIKDVLGQTTELTFSNIKINPRLSKDLFIFEPPKGVDVVGEVVR